VKDAVLNAIDKLPVFDRLKLVAESPIHDWLAVAVSATAVVVAVLS
jgi:hypothetical protein